MWSPVGQIYIYIREVRFGKCTVSVCACACACACEDIKLAMDRFTQTDIIFIDFRKAFDNKGS